MFPQDAVRTISIHALREESDASIQSAVPNLAIFQSTPSARRATLIAGLSTFWSRFQSTPSARRATGNLRGKRPGGRISIHALREESDVDCRVVYVLVPISIHALREESDWKSPGEATRRQNFNPRPPRGERHSTPSARPSAVMISIHALREESDPRPAAYERALRYFNPRPPRGERPCVRLRARAHARNFNPRPPRGGRPW